jgi:hypothetical protein
MPKNNKEVGYIFELVYNGKNKDFIKYLNDNSKIFSKGNELYYPKNTYFFYAANENFIFKKIYLINRKTKLIKIISNKIYDEEILKENVNIRLIF